VIERPPGDVFDWVADYRNVPSALEGVRRWRPHGEQTQGAGARFDVEITALGFPLASVLVLDAWDRPRAIGWRSASGHMPQRGTWQFRPVRDGTELSLTVTYNPPGGALAGLIAGRVEGHMRGRLEESLERIKALLEEE
jgi:uncharacterized membrane protein